MDAGAGDDVIRPDVLPLVSLDIDAGASDDFVSGSATADVIAGGAADTLATDCGV